MSSRKKRRIVGRIVGPVEIADLLKVKRATVYRWRERGVLPPPLDEVSGGAIWDEEVILRWAETTGRLREPEPALAS